VIRSGSARLVPWDAREGEIAPKSRAGRRDVPIYAPLRAHLAEHRLRCVGDGLVFGRTDGSPFLPSTANERAERAWKAAKLAPVGLHEARHCAASFMIAAGVNLKAVSTFMGHSTITITLDRYGHLLPGSEAEAATLMDAYLASACP
jgi:integrase